MKFVRTEAGMTEFPSLSDLNPFPDLIKSQWESFLQWVTTGFTQISGQLLDAGLDVCFIGGIVCVLFAIFGSKRAAKGVYWSVATYFILNIVRSVVF